MYRNIILAAMIVLCAVARAQELVDNPKTAAPVVANAVALAYSDEYGITHADGVWVISAVIISAEQRFCKVTFSLHHSAEAYAGGAKPTRLHVWYAREIDQLAAANFDALIDWIVRAAIVLNPALADGVPVKIEKN